MQELEAMNITMRIITDENVDQLLGMSYSNNINKLLKSEGSTLEEVIQKYTSEVNTILRKESSNLFPVGNQSPEIPSPIIDTPVDQNNPLSLINPEQSSHQYPSSVSPAYVPASPGYNTGSPGYNTGSPAYATGSPAYVPVSPAYDPGSPAYVPAGSSGSSFNYMPGSSSSSPAYVPAAINYGTPENGPPRQFQPYSPQSPQSPQFVIAQPVMTQGMSPIILQQPLQFTPTSPDMPPPQSILNVEETKIENGSEEKSESKNNDDSGEKKVSFNVPSENASSSNETRKITL
jgi:hypothetical protein